MPASLTQPPPYIYRLIIEYMLPGKVDGTILNLSILQAFTDIQTLGSVITIPTIPDRSLQLSVTRIIETDTTPLLILGGIYHPLPLFLDELQQLAENGWESLSR